MSLLIGNLHAEEAWAGGRSTPTRASLAAAAGAATLLRLLAADGDTIHLPAEIDSTCIAKAEGLPDCRFVTEPTAVTNGRLAWGETTGLPPWSPRADRIGVDWIDALWRTPPPDVEVARRVNDRRFDLEVAETLGVALPGAVTAVGWEKTERAVLELAGTPWIVKAAHSAAGRHRVRGESLDDPATRRAIAALVARGPVRVEPWLAGTRDLSVAARVDADGTTHLIGDQLPETDAGGRFRGDRIGAPVAEMRTVARGVGEALSRAGYRGPFGTDGLEYRPADGKRRIHPLVEINARLTFGHVMHAAAARLGRDDLILRFGKGAIPDAARPLLTSGGGRAIAVWLEC